jgi:transcriptional regulator with XRE-family HTH domain
MRNDRLKSYRLKRHLTQEQLALELETDKKQINRWENGESDPSAGRLADLSRVLNISVDYLLGISDNPSPETKLSNMTEDEIEVISAMRKGDKIEAISIIVNSEKRPPVGV